MRYHATAYHRDNTIKRVEKSSNQQGQELEHRIAKEKEDEKENETFSFYILCIANCLSVSARLYKVEALLFWMGIHDNNYSSQHKLRNDKNICYR